MIWFRTGRGWGCSGVGCLISLVVSVLLSIVLTVVLNLLAGSAG